MRYASRHAARPRLVVVLLAAPRCQPAGSSRPAPGAELLHRPLDQILDVNVRDGLVYYRALKGERGRLDRYVASLNVTPATYQGWSKAQQMAFWVNAYNAFVLADGHQPLSDARARSSRFPARSTRRPWRAAGRTVTLDQIEKTILPEFKEPRLYLALGRGAVGSGRLRSEAYTGDRLEKQLADIQSEFVNDRHMYRLDRLANTHRGHADPELARSGVRRGLRGQGRRGVRAALADRAGASIAFVTPHLLPSEKEFVQKNELKMTFLEMDWRLNDLTGGRVE